MSNESLNPNQFRFRQPSTNALFDIRFRREHVWFCQDTGKFEPAEEGADWAEHYHGDSIRTNCVMSKIDESKPGKDRYSMVYTAFVVRHTKDRPSKRVEAYKRSLTKMLKYVQDKQFRTIIWNTFHKVFRTGIQMKAIVIPTIVAPKTVNV